MTSLKINDKATGIYYLRVPVDARVACTGISILIKSGKHPAVRKLLPPGEFEILGCASTDSIDEGLKGIVDKVAEAGDESKPETYACLWRNYKYDVPQPVTFTFGTWQQSFLSLLKYNGVELKENEKLLFIQSLKK